MSADNHDSDTRTRAGWTRVLLRDICTDITDGTHKTPKYVEEGIPFVSTANLVPFKEGLDFSDYRRFITVDEHRELSRRCRPERGDLLLSKCGTIGRCKEVDVDFEFSLFVGLALLKPLRGLFASKFGEYLLNQKALTDRFIELSPGSTRRTLTLTAIKSVEVELPPLAEQQRIVAKLEDVLPRVNAARERLAKVPTILKRFRQSVLAAACSGRLTADWRVHRPQPEASPDKHPDELFNVPAGWRWCQMSELISSVRSGSTAVPQNEVTAYPILRSSSVRPRAVDLTDARFVQEKDSRNEDLFLRDGDLLFTRLSGSVEYVANCAIVRNLGSARLQYPDRLFRVRLRDQRVAGYIEYMFEAPFVRKRIAELAKSSAGHQRISQGGITEQWVPLPPKDELDEIVRRLDGLFSLAAKVEARVVASRMRAEKLVQATLAKAFKGDLVPTEAELAEAEGREYESAEALLERIRQARAVNGQAASPRRRRTASPTPPSNGKYHETLFGESVPASGSGRASGAKEGSRATAEAAKRSQKPQNGSDDDGWVEISYDEAMGYVREAFAEGGARDREQAIKDVAVALGYQRVGSRVRETVDGYLRAAVRRGILVNENGQYSLLVRSGADYTRDHLIDSMISSMNGGWSHREDVIKATATHLGFQKAGSAFKEVMKSAINGAIRRDLLESDGPMIRKR